MKHQSLLLLLTQVYQNISQLIQNQLQQEAFGLKQLLQMVAQTIKLRSMQLLHNFGQQLQHQYMIQLKRQFMHLISQEAERVLL